ncbi:hypothetical protein V1525DRAFT_361942 [Lipomyces kononenkoae]|uniref:Uncharacterized protein n=1 Tax=Lipomyces kononenkoae TaxID=34357 RepID=A0ACC3T1I1_LIPKO
MSVAGLVSWSSSHAKRVPGRVLRQISYGRPVLGTSTLTDSDLLDLISVGVDNNDDEQVSRTNTADKTIIRELPDVYENPWASTHGAVDPRFHPHTMLGKARLRSVELPEAVNKVIGGSPSDMKLLRRDVQMIYHLASQAARTGGSTAAAAATSTTTASSSKSLKSILETPHRGLVDAYLAAMFPQNFTSALYALSEARRRLGPSWRPNRVLDVGNGPATGILALNEVFEGSDSWRPERVECVVFGDMLMARRGMQMLQEQKLEHQMNQDKNNNLEPENRDDIDQEFERRDQQQKIEDAEAVGTEHTVEAGKPTITAADDVDRRYNAKFRLNRLPGKATSKFDLIMAMHHLVLPTEKKPSVSDKRVKDLLKLLAPGGVLVIVERGNVFGFERIARAREFILRPTNRRTISLTERNLRKAWQADKDLYPAGFVKEFTGSANVEQIEKVYNEDELTDEEREELQQLIIKQDDLLIQDSSKLRSKVTHGLRVIAPCPHHRQCPMQFRNVDENATRSHWCHFPQMMQKPRWLIELKKGKQLALHWKGGGRKSDKSGQSLSGNGRSGGRNYERARLSYLVVQRAVESRSNNSNNDEDTTGVQDRLNLPEHSDLAQSLHWPRLINQPLKRDKHVILDLCSHNGYIERWVVNKSAGKQAYHDVRKASWGDLWALSAKTQNVRRIVQTPRDQTENEKYRNQDQYEDDDKNASTDSEAENDQDASDLDSELSSEFTERDDEFLRRRYNYQY